MREVIADGHSIELLVTLTPEQGQRAQVAGYMDLRPFACEHGIEVYHPKCYSLKPDEDRNQLLQRDIGCLLVIGWQRLIPSWWLDALQAGAFGMHGSPEPLPRGRGRSPLNWSLAAGKTSFLTHLFRYDAGIDSGKILAAEKFEINAWDDCESLHFKNRIAMNRLLRQHLSQILDGSAVYQPQPDDVEPTFFPKRTAEDGRIEWFAMDMIRLHNHVRCQTKPFPGAFSFLEGSNERFYFWKAAPFDGHMTYPGKLPGTVVERFYDDSFVVAVWDGSVRVTDYTSPNHAVPEIGQRFFDKPYLCEAKCQAEEAAVGSAT
ncbi:MAG: hypothetical protein KDA57_17350 [Planctomycetales bacterium]|nr:hypothetical protein [Planctomycetales bacterium]